MESDKESDDNSQPPQGIDDVLASIHARYPAMEFPQYVDKLKDHGILYLVTAAHFNIQFYGGENQDARGCRMHVSRQCLQCSYEGGTREDEKEDKREKEGTSTA